MDYTEKGVREALITTEERRLTLHYIAIQSLFLLSACSVNGFISYFLTHNGFDRLQVGLCISSANLLSLLFQPYAAQFADRSVRFCLKHMVALLASAAIFFALILLVTPPKSVLFLPLYILIIFLISIQVPLITGLATEHISTGLRVNFSIARGFGSIAFAAMSILIGTLSKDFGPKITLLGFASCGTVYVLSVLSFPQAQKTSTQGFDVQALNILEFAWRNKRFMMAAFAMFFIYSSAAIISSFLFQIVENVRGDSSTLGKMLAMAASVELISMLLYPYAQKLLGSNVNVIKFSSAAFLVKAIFTWQAGSIGTLYFAQFLQFFSYGFFIPAQVYYVLRNISKHDQVKGQMFMSFSTTLAVVFASLSGGYLIEHLGLRSTLLFGVGLTVVGLLILFIFLEPDR